MADNSIDSTSKLLDKAGEMADNIASKMTSLAEKYGPDVVDAGLAVVRIAGLQSIMTGLVCGIFAALILRYISWPCVAKTKTQYNNDPQDFPFWILGVVFPIIPSFFLLLEFVSRVANIWNWIQIFYPQLYVAKRILEAGVGKI